MIKLLTESALSYKSSSKKPTNRESWKYLFNNRNQSKFYKKSEQNKVENIKQNWKKFNLKRLLAWKMKHKKKLNWKFMILKFCEKKKDFCDFKQLLFFLELWL